MPMVVLEVVQMVVFRNPSLVKSKWTASERRVHEVGQRFPSIGGRGTRSPEARQGARRPSTRLKRRPAERSSSIGARPRTGFPKGNLHIYVCAPDLASCGRQVVRQDRLFRAAPPSSEAPRDADGDACWSLCARSRSRTGQVVHLPTWAHLETAGNHACRR